MNRRFFHAVVVWYLRARMVGLWTERPTRARRDGRPSCSITDIGFPLWMGRPIVGLACSNRSRSRRRRGYGSLLGCTYGGSGGFRSNMFVSATEAGVPPGLGCFGGCAGARSRNWSGVVTREWCDTLIFTPLSSNKNLLRNHRSRLRNIRCLCFPRHIIIFN
jgi:hypothetical protein